MDIIGKINKWRSKDPTTRDQVAAPDGDPANPGSADSYVSTEPAAHASPSLQPEAIAGAVPWTPVAEPAAKVRLRKAARIALAAVLVFAVASGVRSWFRSDSGSTSAPVSAEQQFPAGQAATVAARFIVSWWTWSDENPGGRDSAVALDFTGDPAAGFAGQPGKQVATKGSVWSLAATSATTANATAIAYVTQYTRNPRTKAYTAGGGQWRALDFPVQVTGDRVSVTGPPGEVGIPAPQGGVAVQSPDSDEALTTATQDDVTPFFAAYGSSSAVGALTAPGAHVTGLASRLTLARITSWTVYSGQPSLRTARAVVEWTEPGGNVSTSAYAVTITKVTGGAGDRWQVFTITGTN